MTQEEFQQLGAAYALGSLEGEDLERFRTYLATAGPAERRDLEELLATASLLPLALERTSPPPGVREALLRQVRLSAQAEASVATRTTEPPAPQTPARQSRVWFAVALASILALAGLGIVVARLLGTVEEERSRAATAGEHAARLNAQLVALKDELARKEALLQVLSSRKIAVTVMNGLQVNPAGYGKVIWDPDTRVAILQVSSLPTIPPDKDYQLWVIKGKTPISAGVFAVSDTTANFYRVEGLAVADPLQIAAFAVTLEPKGGVPAPTGQMYLAGSPRQL